MESILDVLIYIIIIGAAVAVFGGLICAIHRLIGKIQDLDTARRRRESVSAIQLYHMVQLRVSGELTPAEYERTVQYTVRKHPDLADRSGVLNLSRQSPEYIAELVTEAVNQNRISRGTLAMAEADRETKNQSKERGKTA